MINQLAKFLRQRHTNELPILLGFSGGPDSLALLHLLLELRKTKSLKFSVAHVDHGWREESSREASEIEAMIKALGLPFYLHILDPKTLKGNLEEACREERLRFFASICKQHGYEAVLLAHHADDVAETVLKRTLEGATLSLLSGIRPETKIYGMTIWRPLLNVAKAEILKWLADRKLEGLSDKTNFDSKFLRARMRTHIIPHLTDVFGKEVSRGLCHISAESEELRHYLDAQVEPYFAKRVDGKLAAFLDLSVDCPKNFFELKHLIRLFCKTYSFELSRESLAAGAQIILEKKANKTLIVGAGTGKKILYLDRGCLFILRHEFSQNLENWKLKIEDCSEKECIPTDWKSLLEFGKGEVIIPLGNYRLMYPVPTPMLSKLWAQHKVPSFLRFHIPLIVEGEEIRYEFLTGKRLKRGDETLKLTMNYEGTG